MQTEKIIQVLGKPYFANEFVIIYNLDCKIGLTKMIDSGLKVATTITSPPYNIGKEYENSLSITEYVNWLVSVSDLVYKVTKNDGAYLLNLGYLKIENQARALPIPYLIWDKIKFFLNQEIVWNYGAGVACKNYLSPRNEKILWYVKSLETHTFNLDAIRDPDVKYPNSKKNGRLRANSLGKNPSDVWQIAKVTTGANRASQERTDHPAQFPEDLVQRMVVGFTNENDLILDTFLGSGTTAVVAMKNKRLCIELNTQYCEMAKERIIEAENLLKIQNTSLF